MIRPMIRSMISSMIKPMVTVEEDIVTPPTEAVVLFNEVSQPLVANISHDLYGSIAALFVVDSTNNVVKDLVSGLTQPITSGVTGVGDLDTFKEVVTFSGLLTRSSYDDLSIMAFGEFATAYGKENAVELIPTNPLEYLRLMVDAHWDSGGYTKAENNWKSLGSIVLSNHTALSSIAVTIGTDNTSLYNDNTEVESGTNTYRDISVIDDAVTVNLGGTVSAIKLIAIFNAEVSAEQYSILRQDYLNLLGNTGNGLTIPVDGAPEETPEEPPEEPPEEIPEGTNPPAASSIILSAVPSDGLYRTTARKAAISASYTNSSEHYDDMEAKIVSSNLVTGDYTQWYTSFVHGRINTLLTAYNINSDVSYLNQAKAAFYSRYVTIKWEQTNDSYTGRNDFRAEGSSAMVLATQLAPYFSAAENAAIQAEIVKWANYWLTYMNYENSFEGVRWEDTDETTSLCESFLVFSLVINDTTLASKCLATFDHLYHEVETYLVNGVCSSGFWCESTPYNANTSKNYLRMRILANEHTDLPDQQSFVYSLWDAYVQQYLNTDSTHIWWQGDVENEDEVYCDQTESRYISYYDTIVELLKGDGREAECVYFRGLIDDSANDYSGAFRVNFQDTRTVAVKPLSLPLYKKSTGGMGIQVMRNSWDLDNTVATMFNHAHVVDHNQREPLGFNLFHKGEAVTKQMTAYDMIPPFNGCYLEGHNSNIQAIAAYVYGSPVQYNTISNPIYAYTCGDTRDTFNQTGWEKYVICEQFSRAIFIDYTNRVVLTYDHIVTDPNINEDMDSEPATPWARQIERHHRFMHKTVAPTLSSGIYSGEYNGIVQHYEPLLAVDSIEVIEEVTHADYSTRSEHAFRVDQAAYQVREHIQSSDAELMSLLTYGETGQVAATHSAVTGITGNVIGTVVNGNTVVLFNKTPETPLTGTIEFTVGDASLVTNVYVLGVDSALSYDKAINTNTITLTVGSNTSVNSESVLVI